MTVETIDLIRAPIAIDPRWSRVDGLTATSSEVTIEPEQFFYSFNRPSWTIVDWSDLREDWGNLRETPERSLEQVCLEYIKAHGKETRDPAEVLATAWEVYSFLFDAEAMDCNSDPELNALYLKALRETSILMALNAVSLNGELVNVSVAWFLPLCAQKIYDLTDDQAREVDELYHSGWFYEERRNDFLRAHIALGGRLIHGCSSSADMKGGVVAPYGVDVSAFMRELDAVTDACVAKIAAIEP